MRVLKFLRKSIVIVGSALVLTIIAVLMLVYLGGIYMQVKR
ncbi:hypothetical protein [Listeria booriae]|nr:hypothetical protein [Listeria booriae]